MRNRLKGEEPELLIQNLERGNQAALERVGVEITKATYYKYRRSLQYMQEFLRENYKVQNFTIRKITAKFFEDYFHFLYIFYDLQNSAKMCIN